jgi:hypothetical protein
MIFEIRNGIALNVSVGRLQIRYPGVKNVGGNGRAKRGGGKFRGKRRKRPGILLGSGGGEHGGERKEKVTGEIEREKNDGVS